MERLSISCEVNGGDIVNTRTLGIGLLAAVLLICSVSAIAIETDAAEPSITDIDYSSDDSHITVTTEGVGEGHVLTITKNGVAVAFHGISSDVEDWKTASILEPGAYSAAIKDMSGTIKDTVTFTIWTVSFDTNGGTGSMDEVYATGTYVPPATAGGMAGPDGAEFLGWSTTADGDPVESVEITRNTTLYAVWDSGEPSEPVAVDGVTIDESSITLVVGGNQTLVATVTPADADDKSVTWSSSNSSVAIVTDGVVTAVSPGTATITVTTVDGGYTATCQVTVEAAEVHVNGVSLDRSEMTLVEGQTGSLVATVSPGNATDKSVTWSVDDDSVVNVDQNGGVTAVSPGTATVTVTTVDGGYTATCQVTVEERAVTGIKATPDRSVYTVGDVFDDGVSVELVYNDGSREPLSEGYAVDASAVDMSTPGTYTVTVTYQTFTATFDVTVRAPGDVAISVTVIGGGPTNKVVLTVDGVETEFTRNGTLVVEEGSVVTVAYNTSGLLDPTITVGGEPISNGGTFVAGSDTTLRVVFFVDDDDDNPVNPPVVATGDDDDDVVYAVAIAAGVIVAVLVAVYVIYGRKD